MENFQTINVQIIDRPNPPVRSQFNEEEIQALTESIREKGILVPLLVRKNGERYEVIDGDCRLEASYRLRLREVPCVVRDATDSETHVLRMLANLDRSNPDTVSEAIYIARVINSGVLTLEQYAEKLNRSPAWIGDRLAIAEMPDYMQDAIRQGKLSLGVALALYEVDDDHTRRNWVAHAILQGMTVSAANYALQDYNRLKELRQHSSSASEVVLPPEIPPVILFPCEKCGEAAEPEDMRLVRIHRQECSVPQ